MESPQKVIYVNKPQAISLLGVFNLFALFLEVLVVVYLMKTSFEPGLIFLPHTLSMSFSILYHIFPAIRHNTVYRVIAHAFSSLVLGILVIGVVMLVLSNGGFDALGWIIILVGFIGPSAFVAATLLMMLNYDEMSTREVQPQVQYVLIAPHAMV